MANFDFILDGGEYSAPVTHKTYKEICKSVKGDVFKMVVSTDLPSLNHMSKVISVVVGESVEKTEEMIYNHGVAEVYADVYTPLLLTLIEGGRPINIKVSEEDEEAGKKRRRRKS